MKSLNLCSDTSHRQRIQNQISHSFSNFIHLLIDVPKDSILGLRLFNICICDLFFFVEEENVTSYADDTTPYSDSDNVVTILEEIETNTTGKLYVVGVFFWSVFCLMRTEYSAFSPNAEKYGPEKLRIRILHTQWNGKILNGSHWIILNLILRVTPAN